MRQNEYLWSKGLTDASQLFTDTFDRVRVGISSMIMPGVAQFMRLPASACVCVRLCASVCVCSRQGFRMRASVCVCLRLPASVCVCVRLCASVHVKGSECVRLCASACVCLRLCASVCVCSRQGFRMRASVCVCSRQGFRMRASVCVCVRLFTSRVPNACVCVRLLASASVCSRLRLCASARVCVRLSHVGRLVSRLCASACECSRQRFRMLASACVGRLVSRRSSCLASVCVCLRELAHFMRLPASVVIQRVQRWGELAQVFAICLASYYPLAVSYNVLMLKYPSHHLIYVFYHPMPIMPLY